MLNELTKKISQIVPVSQAVAEAEILLEFVSGYTKKDFFINPEITLTQEQDFLLESLLQKRLNERIPVQYLTSQAWFMGEVFFVNENVLIPRPETELLVEEVINISQNIQNPSILDIGTGSGVIPVMLKKLLSCTVTGVDISSKALEVAVYNSKKFGMEIKFFESDLFSDVKEKFDIIVSNPPYIPRQEIKNLSSEVLNEPHLALFTNDEKGIEVYEKIISNASKYLNPNGYIVFELGIDESSLVEELFKKYNYNDIKISHDLSGIERIISAKKLNNT